MSKRSAHTHTRVRRTHTHMTYVHTHTHTIINFIIVPNARYRYVRRQISFTALVMHLNQYSSGTTTTDWVTQRRSKTLTSRASKSNILGAIHGGKNYAIDRECIIKLVFTKILQNCCISISDQRECEHPHNLFYF